MKMFKKMAILFAVLFFMSALTIGVLFKISNTQEDDATVINMAGRQRMLTQKISKESFIVCSDTATSSDNDNLSSTVELFDTNLKALIHGNKDLGIPETKDELIKTQLLIVENLWIDFKANAEIIVAGGPNMEDARQYIALHNIELLDEMDLAVDMFEKESRSDVHNIYFSLLIMVTFNGIILASGLMYIAGNVIQPIKKLEKISTKISGGEYGLEIDIGAQSDEIGNIGRNFEIIQGNIKRISEHSSHEKPGSRNEKICKYIEK